MASNVTFYAEGKVLNGVYLSDYVESDDISYANATKFVSADASGGGVGTLGDPWTLTEAMEQVTLGDMVGIKAGDYVGAAPYAAEPSWHKLMPAFYPHTGAPGVSGSTSNGFDAISGTAVNPIIFVAENFGAVNSTGFSNIHSGATVQGQGWPAFGCWHNDYVYYYGLYSNENEANSKVYTESGTSTAFSSDNIKFKYNKLLGATGADPDNHAAIRLNTVDTVEVTDNYLSGYELGDGSYVNQAGVQTYGTTNAIIDYNEIRDCGHAIHNKGHDHYNIVCRNNLIVDCVHPWRSHALVLGPANERNKFYQNLLVGNQKLWEITSSATVPEAATGTDIFNNTVYSTAGNDALVEITDLVATAGGGNKLANNVIYVTGLTSMLSRTSTTIAQFVAYIEASHNNFYGSPTYFSNGSSSYDIYRRTFSDYQTIGGETGNLDSDPTMVNPAGGDYTLDTGSPCLDSGVDIGDLLGGGVEASINRGAFISAGQTETFGPRAL